MSQLQAEIEIHSALDVRLNWVQLIAIGVGGIIGAGIVVLSGQAAARYAGPSIILSFLLTGVVVLLSTLSFSELAAMMSSSGAAYTYTYAALGEYAAWFIGWNYALLYQLGALTVVNGWSKYVVYFIESISDYNVTSKVVQAPVAWNETGQEFYVTGQVINIPAIAITIAITLVLIIGIHQTAIVTLVLVIIKVVILLIFIFASCKHVNTDNYTPFFPSNEGTFSKYGVSGMIHGCTYIFFAYVGFEVVATVAQEAKPPRSRSVPFAIIGSTVISLLIYIGICTVMVGLVPYKLLNTGSPLFEAIKATGYGNWLRILMNLGGIAALASVALTMLLGQIRVFYAMAHDGLLPGVFSKINRRTKTPLISTIISGTFCAILSGLCPVDIVGETTTITALITYIFVHIEVIVMRWTHQDVDRNFKVPCGRWLIPTVGAILCIFLLRGISKEGAYKFLIWTAIGQIVYFSYGYWHSRMRHIAPRQSLKSIQDLLPTVESLGMQILENEVEPDLISEISETKSVKEEEGDIIAYF